MIQQESQQIEVREAVKIARDYLKYVYDGEELANLLLEEVEFEEETNHWLITFGFDTPNPNFPDRSPSPSFSVAKERQHAFVRHYKRVMLDAVTGKPQAIKIREV